MNPNSVPRQAPSLLSVTYVEVAIGVEPDARHVGGLNLFGRGFGTFPLDLVLRLRHRVAEG